MKDSRRRTTDDGRQTTDACSVPGAALAKDSIGATDREVVIRTRTVRTDSGEFDCFPKLADESISGGRFVAAEPVEAKAPAPKRTFADERFRDR